MLGVDRVAQSADRFAPEREGRFGVPAAAQVQPEVGGAGEREGVPWAEQLPMAFVCAAREVPGRLVVAGRAEGRGQVERGGQ